MKCGFCGHEYDEADGKKGCGGCPGGCHSVHCPRCNYKNPLEPGLIKSIKKLFKKNDTHKRRCRMKLTDKAEEILEALWIAVEEEGAPFLDPEKSGMGIDDPAYSELTQQALIEIRQGMVYFRPEGKDEGRMTIRRHRLAERLMMDVLNIRGEDGDNQACQFEHLLNEGVDVKICTMLNHPTTCPHGKPIPPGDCCIEARTKGDLGVVPLTEFKSGQEGEIAYIQTEDNKKMQKLMAMGVLPGNDITLVQSFPSYIFRVGYSEFAIDSNLAREIFVRKRENS